MTTYERTPTEVVVTMLDLTTVTETVNEWLDEHRDDPDLGRQVEKNTRLKVAQTWGIVETPNGPYVLCTEGVGPAGAVTDDDPFDVELFTETVDEDGKTTSFGIIAFGSVPLGPTELRELATGEQVNLRTFVRTFGHRLDANYEQWRRTLEVALGVPAEAV